MFDSESSANCASLFMNLIRKIDLDEMSEAEQKIAQAQYHTMAVS